MAVTYDKEQRAIAKRDKLALFAVDIDGRPSKDGVTGRYTSDGIRQRIPSKEKRK